MIDIKNENVVTFDVDDTLIMWDETGYAWSPNEAHVDEIRKFKRRGQFVIVWSAGGYEWARSAVKLLGIDKYVDLVMSKPKWMFDDKEPQEWTRLCYKGDKNARKD